MKPGFILLSLLAACLLTGCASTGAGSPERNRLLYEVRDAASLLHRADFAGAKPLLEDAVTRLGGLTAGDRSARKARGYFKEESSKNFRGEPYERVMAFYYRGILYWMDGEPDNARACFRSAQLEDSDAENGQYQSDYALLDYLDGFITTRLGGGAAESLARARSNVRNGVNLPDFDPKANVVIFFEMGNGPTKYAGGEYSEQLRFRNGSSRSASVRITDGARSWTAAPVDDLSFQATTRGGRVMDYVLANKARFKGATDSVGDAALISGGLLAIAGSGRNSVADEVGVGLLAAGLVSKIVSAATTPAADTRAWDNLPNLLGFSALRLAPGEHRLVVEFLDAGGRPTFSRDVSFTVPPDGRDTVLFFSDHP